MNDFIKGLLFGATVGGAGGLLLAPRSGKETQKMVENYVDDTTEATKELNESLQHFRKAVEDTQQVIEETIPAVKVSLQKDIDAFKFQAEPRVERINEQVEQLQGHIAKIPTISDKKA